MVVCECETALVKRGGVRIVCRRTKREERNTE